MNNKITIDKIDGNWYCFLTEYNALPFGDIKDNVIKTIKAKTYTKLIEEIASQGLFDLVNKNQ